MFCRAKIKQSVGGLILAVTLGLGSNTAFAQHHGGGGHTGGGGHMGGGGYGGGGHYHGGYGGGGHYHGGYGGGGHYHGGYGGGGYYGGGVPYIGFGFGGLGYSNFGLGYSSFGLGYSGLGLGYSNFGFGGLDYDGGSYYSPSYSSAYRYAAPQVYYGSAVPTYSYSTPSQDSGLSPYGSQLYSPPQTARRVDPSVPGTVLRPGMVLDDGSVVVSVDPPK